MVRHLTELKKVFGNVTSQMANRICSVVCEITPLLPADCIEFIKSQSNGQSTGDSSATSLRKPWGNHIKCVVPNVVPDENQIALLQQYGNNEPITNLKAIKNFSMKYDTVPSGGGSSSKTKTDIAKSLNRSWLLKHVNSDLIPALIAVLKSKKTNDELQNELIDMLGFDKFDAIQMIFDHRKQIIVNVENEDKKKILKDKAAALENNGTKGIVPAVASQVVVQSETELNIKKQLRRDEKRLRNLLNADKSENDDVEPGDDIELESNMVKASKIHLQQQQNILNALQRQPILSKDRPDEIPDFNNPLFNNSTPRIKYPFVFDEQISARSHVGFIAGSKLTLPENVQRIENRMYDEVKLPSNDLPTDLKVGDQRVRIDQLDEIGQMAFAGTKELNRIQSVVYPTAYHSNENLLVCAPTGAGKTNVAMLTIVHAIRAHTDQGVIHRDQFKIVYVAPMKALAAEMVENFGKRLKPLGKRYHFGLLSVRYQNVIKIK